ncbi:MAG: Mur ligase family protein [Leptospiraceae bacterium]|nr:Mur ligase family protein [Leptospiraceae bacterium]MDW7976798.1 Mur ligase family protein [Leptospiraceae bacterium]
MKIHVVGIGGIAMGNLAKMLKDQGHDVTGSDQNLYPPMSEKLKEWGFPVSSFSPDNIIDQHQNPKADLYIIGNVLSRGNIEVETILNHRLPLMSMPQALYEFFLKHHYVIVVAGTHGKTTTTFLIHYILKKAGLSAGLFAGGIRADHHPGFSIEKGNYFVIEGDEYDTSFFDKKPKFLHYRPYYLVLTSIEYDHADIYENLKEYKKAFLQLLRWIPQKGKIIANYDYEVIREILKNQSNVVYYSEKERLPEITQLQYQRNELILPIGRVHPKIFGKQNYLNILASYLLAKELGVDAQIIRQAIEEFPGVMRRQQLRKKISLRDQEIEILFYEDFAHHPTAVKITIESFRETITNAFIIACYEPRSASSHRNVFQKEYPESFLLADVVYITEVYDPRKVEPEQRLNVLEIIDEIRKKNINAHYCAAPNELLEKLKNDFSDYVLFAKQKKLNKIILLFMSNGEFGNIYPEVENWLEDLEKS